MKKKINKYSKSYQNLFYNTKSFNKLINKYFNNYLYKMQNILDVLKKSQEAHMILIKC